MANPLDALNRLYENVVRPGTSEGESATNPVPRVSASDARLATVANSKDNPAEMTRQLPAQNTLAAQERAQQISDLAMDAGITAPPSAPPPEQPEKKPAPKAEQPEAPAQPAEVPSWVDKVTDEDFASILSRDTGGMAKVGGVVNTADGKTVRAIETDPGTLQNMLNSGMYDPKKFVFKVQADTDTWRNLVYSHPDLTIERTPTPAEKLDQGIREAKENAQVELAATEQVANQVYPASQVEGMLRKREPTEISLKRRDALLKELERAQDSQSSISYADDAMRAVLASDLDPAEKQSKIKSIETIKAKAQERAKQIPFIQARIALSEAAPNYMQRGYEELEKMEKEAKTPAQKRAIQFFKGYNEDVTRPRPADDYTALAHDVDTYISGINESRSAFDRVRGTKVLESLARVRKLAAQGDDIFPMIIDIGGASPEDVSNVMAATNMIQLEGALKNRKELASAAALGVAMARDEKFENALNSFAAQVQAGGSKEELAGQLKADTTEKEDKTTGPNLFSQAKALLGSPMGRRYLIKAGYDEKDISDLLASPARIRNAIMLIAPDTSRDIVKRSGMLAFFSPEETRDYYERGYSDPRQRISDVLKDRAVMEEFKIGNTAWMQKYLDDIARRQ